MYRRTTFRGLPGLYLEAYGTSDQLQEVQNTIQTMEDSSNNFVSARARNITFVNEAYRCLFPGSESEESELQMAPYRGAHNTEHDDNSLYCPIIKDRNDDRYFERTLRLAFEDQFEIARTNFDPNVHGELRIAITFGTFYLFNIKPTTPSMSIDVLQHELGGSIGLRDRQLSMFTKKPPAKRYGRNKKDVGIQQKPTKRSFMPRSCNIDSMEHFLSTNKFELVNKTLKYHATMKFGGAEHGKHQDGIAVFNEEQMFLEFRLADIKWMAADICCSNDNMGQKKMDARLKIQSRRCVKADVVKEMHDTSGLLDPSIKVFLKTNDSIYVHKNFVDKIRFVRRKDVSTYKYSGPPDVVNIWHGIDINIATVTEYSRLNQISRAFENQRTIQEITIIPPFPDLDIDKDSLKDFVHNISKSINELLDVI